MKYLLLRVWLLGLPAIRADARPSLLFVVIWDEQQPAQQQAYPEFLGEYIVAHVRDSRGFPFDPFPSKRTEPGLGAAV